MKKWPIWTMWYEVTGIEGINLTPDYAPRVIVMVSVTTLRNLMHHIIILRA